VHRCIPPNLPEEEFEVTIFWVCAERPLDGRALGDGHVDRRNWPWRSGGNFGRRLQCEVSLIWIDASPALHALPSDPTERTRNLHLPPPDPRGLRSR
jgi:hypothetical protein